MSSWDILRSLRLLLFKFFYFEQGREELLVIKLLVIREEGFAQGPCVYNL